MDEKTGLELLEHSELIAWIRENVQGINENEIAWKVLRERADLYRLKLEEVDLKANEIENKIRTLLEPYADGQELKPGIRIRRPPKTVMDEYKKLDQERSNAKKDWFEWFDKQSEAFNQSINAFDDFICSKYK